MDRNGLVIASSGDIQTEMAQSPHDELVLKHIAQMLPTLMHETKNALASLVCGIDLLTDVDNSVKTLLHGELDRLRLALDILSLAERPLRTFSPTPNLSKSFRKSCVALQQRAAHVGVAMAYGLDLSCEVAFDARAVMAVVAGLVSNALYACARGDEIEVNVTAGNEELHIRVLDTGKGMDARTRELCTRPFFSSRRNGSGLGLTLIEAATLRDGGQLELQSTLGVGTTVTIALLPIG